MDFLFFMNSALLGVGLAMDAFSVSMANGLSEPNMSKSRMSLIAGTFGFYQFLMPMIGWLCVHTVLQYFQFFQRFIPWIALLLLSYIGGKMLLEGIREQGDDETKSLPISFGTLMVQGVATSIDALSVGFTISDYNFSAALTASLVIAAVTFVLCIFGLLIGRRFGTKLAGKASIIGGIILIAIGLEIFLTGILK